MNTTASEPRQVDSGRVDEGGRQWPVILAVVVLGLLLGGLVGGVYGATRPVSHAASTALSVQPDPTIDVTSQNSNQNSTPSLDASAYIQSQLVVINGAELAERVRVAEKLPSPPDVSATQVGQTYVVNIVATASTRAKAREIAQETGALYIGNRTTQLRKEISSLLTSTGQQLSGVAKSLGAQKRSTSALTPSQTALQTEYERLLSVRSTLNAVSAQADQVVTVVAPARATKDALSTTEKDLLGGAVLGAVLALTGFLAIRRTIHRVRSVADLAALDVPIILPVQPRRSLRRARRNRAFWNTPQARLLAARLFAEADVERRPLVFVGTTDAVGNTSVAASVAAALVDSGPVLYVQVKPSAETVASDTPRADPDDPAELSAITPSSLPGVWLLDDPQGLVGRGATASERLTRLLDEANRSGWLVIVDAPPLSESDVAARCSRFGAAVILVVGRGRSAPSEVLAATELFEAHGTGMVGAVLNDTVGFARRIFERRSRAHGSEVRASRGRHAGSRPAGPDELVPPAPPREAAPPEVIEPSDRLQEDGDFFVPGFASRPSR